MGCYVQGDKNSMGCFVWGGKLMRDVLSGVAKMAWDVLSRDVLSYIRQRSMMGHHPPASETPFKGRFAGGPMIVRF